MVDSLTVAQISRLSHWLQSQGHTPTEVLDCIDYIANSENPKQAQKKEPESSAATNSENSDS